MTVEIEVPQYSTAIAVGRTSPARSRLASLIHGRSVAAISVAGLLSTTLIAVGSYGAGALPANDPTRAIPVLGLLRHGALGLHVALGLYYAGLIGLIITWLVLGRLLLTGSARGVRPVAAQVVHTAELRRIFTRWTLPLLIGMPLASMDLYSYAAQAQLARHGFNPYTATPADLPGKFLDNVAWKWVDTPSPYGPLWVAVSRWGAALTGNHALIAVLLLRLLPFIALMIIARILPSLAARFGVRGDLALWLVVANPLMLVHGIGGGHNDVVMVVFMIAAICLVSRSDAGTGELLGAAALAALGGAIKAPGLIAVAFLVPLYLSGRAGVRPRDWVRNCLAVGSVAAAVFGLVSVIAGVGLGWTKGINPSVPVINFMSIPTMAAVAYRLSIGTPHAGTVVDQTVRRFRHVGTFLTAASLVLIWFKSTVTLASRVAVMRLLMIGLIATVVLGPAVQPWYFLWALPCLALIPIRPTRLSWVAAGSVALTFLTRPMGSSLEMAPYVPAVIATALASRALLGPAVHRQRGGSATASPSMTAPVAGS